MPGAAGLEYPANYQSRCLFRIEVGRGYSSSAGDDIVYGQAIMLVHVNTGMHLTAITQESVRLQPSLGSGAYFLVEPRYKLRSEGEKVRVRVRVRVRIRVRTRRVRVRARRSSRLG